MPILIRQVSVTRSVCLFSVTCDASDYAVGCYLEQDDKAGQRRPVAFGGIKLSNTETNYSTTEKELSSSYRNPQSLSAVLTSARIRFIYGSSFT